MEMEAVSKKWVVIPFVFFQMVALSTIYYIMPQMVISKVCCGIFNQTVCSHIGTQKFNAEENHVFDEAAIWNTVRQFAAFCPALIITLPLGALTDLVSKKKMLLVPAIANLASCLINLCCSIFMNIHVGFLVLSSFITSIYGEFHCFVMLCCVYSSSVTTAKDRYTVLTIVFISCEFGLGIGSLVANYLLRYYGYPSVFLFVGSGLIMGLLYAIVVIPPTDDVREKSVEGEPPDVWNRVKLHLKDTWIHVFSFGKRPILKSKDKTILLLFIAAFFQMASHGGERALVPLFLKHGPLNFTAHQVGTYFTLNDFSRSAGLITLALIDRRFFTISDYILMIIGVLSTSISATFLSFSKTASMVYLSTIFAIPSSYLAPSVRSQLAKLVSNEEYGVTLSFVSLMGNIGMLFMAVGSNRLFVTTVTIYTGFGILLLASTNMVSLAILLWIVFTEEGDESINDDYNEVSSKED